MDGPRSDKNARFQSLYISVRWVNNLLFTTNRVHKNSINNQWPALNLIKHENITHGKFTCNMNIGLSTDVYAFGIVLFELLSGQLPYSSINNRDQVGSYPKN